MSILLAGSSKPVCFICSENIALFKSGNMKRHYKKHSSFESLPLKSEMKVRKITELQAQYDRSTDSSHIHLQPSNVQTNVH